MSEARNANRALRRGEHVGRKLAEDVIRDPHSVGVELDARDDPSAVRQLPVRRFIDHLRRQLPGAQPVRAGAQMQEGFPVDDQPARGGGLEAIDIGAPVRVRDTRPSRPCRADQTADGGVGVRGRRGDPGADQAGDKRADSVRGPGIVRDAVARPAADRTGGRQGLGRIASEGRRGFPAAAASSRVIAADGFRRCSPSEKRQKAHAAPLWDAGRRRASVLRTGGACACLVLGMRCVREARLARLSRSSVIAAKDF